MEIDPRRLRFLLAVARSGGVLAAADDLRVTPSAVSQQLARLEAEVGRPLVRRTSTGTVLTDDGLALAEAAEDVEKVLTEARARLVDDEDEPGGTVRVGGFHSFLSQVLLPQIPAWRERHPRLHFEIVESAEEETLRKLRAGELDIVILEIDAEQTTRKLPARLTETPLLDEPWKLVVPAGTITTEDSIDLVRLGLPWLGVDPDGAGASALERVRRSTGSAIPTVHRYTETRSALALVAAGEGMALLPSLALEGIMQEGVETLDVPGLGQRRIVLRRHEGRGVAKVVDLAASLIRDAASAVSFGVD
ncbi:LysR family transcriptional regulator [Nocardioides hwasunensis]|uniref:LysR family transcriptional regulator n=1 Tax=Nocardioides hwasunensis TaxID=397258 RepID=A0ABR8MLK6_9ACTN|nr:LysR family transcriptional regulator [Nocardioides hwasunensis]MBD3915667.1 LysR family transcriptional regulator [Nocardioides hwasunensis]